MIDAQRWPIFICYRHVDGFAAARRLHEILDKYSTDGPDGQAIILDAYLDETMPGVADWKALHGPYLEKARAFLVVCTPAAAINEGPGDWVQREIDWWLRERTTAPILIDPLTQGVRYVPDSIKRRWPDIQRLALVEKEWAGLSAPELDAKTDAVRRHILGAILPSGAEIYVQELEDERRRARTLTRALAVSLFLLAAVAVAGFYAYGQREAAITNTRIASASLLDARAASKFAESRLADARWDAEKSRQQDIQRELAALPDGENNAPRRFNLEFEIAQLDDLLQGLAAESAAVRAQGNVDLANADAAWANLISDDGGRTRMTRSRPAPPRIFSVELINAGAGESVLIHYGTPESTSFLMVNGGDLKNVAEFVERRLRQISRVRFHGAPVPIELFIAGDQDAEKTQGLLKILQHLEETPADQRFVDLKGIWANIFETQGRGLRPEIRRLIDALRIPLNRPFDHLVVRPEKGRLQVHMANGLDIVVLGPPLSRLVNLHRSAQQRAEQRDLHEPPLSLETFSQLQIDDRAAPLVPPSAAVVPKDACVPSEHAKSITGARYFDQSVPNLASTVLLFRYEGKTMLHTGDSRGDIILDGLTAARLLDTESRARVDLLHVPHLGSENNVTKDFFARVTAENYLFSGNGRFGTPVKTVAALVDARGCQTYAMYFVNRDRVDESERRGGQGSEELDAFFAEEALFKPNYRRIFRSLERGSVIVDLLDPVRY